jgi:hypothetical protein
MAMANVFDDLHNAIMHQMKEVQHAKNKPPEEREFVIQQSREVSRLAANAVANINAYTRFYNLQTMEGVDNRIISATTPRMLKGNVDEPR